MKDFLKRILKRIGIWKRVGNYSSWNQSREIMFLDSLSCNGRFLPDFDDVFGQSLGGNPIPQVPLQGPGLASASVESAQPLTAD